MKFTRNKELFISCKNLFEDFYKVYCDIKEDILNNPQRSHLSELVRDLDTGTSSVEAYYRKLGITDGMFTGQVPIPSELNKRLFFGDTVTTGVSQFSPGRLVRYSDKDITTDVS